MNSSHWCWPDDIMQKVDGISQSITVQYRAVIVVKFLQIIFHKRDTIQVRYGVSFVRSDSDW